MSGVIDKNGQQWEHCGVCREWVRIEALLYEQPTKELPHGRDICDECATQGEREREELAELGQYLGRCPCGAPEPCVAPRFGGEHVRPEIWER